MSSSYPTDATLSTIFAWMFIVLFPLAIMAAAFERFIIAVAMLFVSMFSCSLSRWFGKKAS